MSVYREPGEVVVLNRFGEKTVISIRRHSFHPVCCGREGRDKLPGSSHWGGEMRRVYTREGGAFVPIGWICVEKVCRAFLSDKPTPEAFGR